MRVSVYCLSLLLCALPVLSANYHIRSLLGNCIVSTDKDRPGSRVITAHGCPSGTVVNVGVSIDAHATTFGPVTGRFGLYIGRSKDGKHLEWVERPYEWQFSPVAIKPFHTIHVPEHDAYWGDAGSRKTVKVDKGHEIWYFEKARA